MRAPLSWLAEHVDFGDRSGVEIAAALTAAGLQVERVEQTGTDIAGVVVAEVVALEELAEFKKPIRWVTLSTGAEQRQVICGATNFAVGDLIAYARPPALLPGGFRIERRDAYGHSSDGMICSAKELGVGEDHTGIVVLGQAGAADLPLGGDVVEALGLRDTVLDISINPDRGYALSMRGVAREIGTALGTQFRDPGLIDAPTATEPAHPVRIDDAVGCDRYVMRVVAGLDPSAVSPQWLRRRLSLAGMRPISLAVDVTNHVMLDLGQPLHAFDRATVQGVIALRRAGAGEQLRTLDGAERALHVEDLVIADDSGPIALAGVMGGASTEITASTRSVLIESAHFDPVSIAYAARRHRLASEASRRFERGVDDAVAPAAAEAAVRLLSELGGASDAGGVTDVDVRPPRPVIELSPELPGRIAGVAYPADAVRRRLVEVGCEVGNDSSGAWRVTPPSWRPDLRRREDLVEEVIRLEGYSELPATVPTAPVGRGLTAMQRRRRIVGRALAEAGYAEVLTPPFVGDAAADALQLGADDERRPSVRLANPVSEQEPWLRASLLPGLFDAVARNVNRGFGDVAVFETGPVFRRRVGESATMPTLPPAQRPTDDQLAAMEAALPDQPRLAAAVLSGRWERPGWWGPGRDVSWADAVDAAVRIAASVGVDLETQPTQDRAPWHPGRCAALLLAGQVVGHAGELHPRVIEACSLPARTVAMELELDSVLAAAPDTVAAPEISAYPAASVDLAVVAPAELPAAELAVALRAGAGPLLESMRLFDVYHGEQVGDGQVSYAFALRMRASDRTLTADEATGVRDAAVAEAARRFGVHLRF